MGDVNGGGYSDFLAGNHSVDLPEVPSARQAYHILGGGQLLSDKKPICRD